MRSFLINKNLSLYYWLKKRIGKRGAFLLANSIEKGILMFGREQMEDRKSYLKVKIGNVFRRVK